MERTLHDKQTNKTWSIQQQDHRTFTSANGGKQKEKEHADAASAVAYIQKEVWSRLKKGMVYVRPEAAAGEPKLHLYTSKGYTGFMPVSGWGDSDTCWFSHIDWDFVKETICWIEPNGELRASYELPCPGMNYELIAVAEANLLLLNRDHAIVGLSVETGDVKHYARPGTSHASTLDVSGTRAVWADGNELVVYDLGADAPYASYPIDVKMYEKHTPQLCAALSPDGTKLAYCIDPSHIMVVDLATGTTTEVQKAAASLTDKLAFSADNSTLFTKEPYSSLYGYDWQAAAGEQVIWERKDVKAAAFDSRRGRIALYRYGHVELFDQQSFQLTMTFPVEHIVKTCSLAFTRDSIAVYTDYGCFSLYAL
ncbi:hypothetical protein [Paenibacillus sp. GCM10027626]|uniref:hypothetical protein n=1 Tax=Paenibacillus sp. GCM10027626 TaxID=3273411 RepID=UPI0036458BB4